MTILETVKETREKLAELEHDQWIAWSKDIAKTELITPARLERWNKLWCPYSELTEVQKDQDREWTDKDMKLIHKLLESLVEECEKRRKKNCYSKGRMTGKHRCDSVCEEFQSFSTIIKEVIKEI